MRHFFSISALLTILFATTACNRTEQPPQNGFSIIGAWELVRTEHPDGRVVKYDTGYYTRCKIYEADSTYYSIELITDGDCVMVRPHEMARYSLHDGVYIENGRTTPFEIRNDSTITTVWDGYTEVFRRATTMTESRKQEIIHTVRAVFTIDQGNTRLADYVFSTSERELRSDNQRLLWIMAILVPAFLMMLLYFFHTLRQKRRLERQLRELQEIRSLRSQPVAHAMKEAEAEFFKSERYQNLRNKIDAGSNFSQKDWDVLEQKLKEVYPGFSTALLQMYQLSQTERRVCMLIKIRATPTDIAGVMKREASTISSMRGRLYRKVFDKHGGAKEWDEFILSL